MPQRMRPISQRPERENILEEFLYKKNTPLDIEEIKIPSFSWVLFKKLKELDFTAWAKVNVVGLRDDKDRFIPMPNGDQIILKDSKLLLIGSGDSIRYAKKIVRKKIRPKELQYVCNVEL
jgi:voltage-gated potassium channel